MSLLESKCFTHCLVLLLGLIDLCLQVFQFVPLLLIQVIEIIESAKDEINFFLIYDVRVTLLMLYIFESTWISSNYEVIF